MWQLGRNLACQGWGQQWRILTHWVCQSLALVIVIRKDATTFLKEVTDAKLFTQNQYAFVVTNGPPPFSWGRQPDLCVCVCVCLQLEFIVLVFLEAHGLCQMTPHEVPCVLSFLHSLSYRLSQIMDNPIVQDSVENLVLGVMRSGSVVMNNPLRLVSLGYQGFQCSGVRCCCCCCDACGRMHRSTLSQQVAVLL